ncbi:DUF4153 domain-containing protein [Bacillus sp. FJAT-29814]|uniref:DUF4153 domain-containing protein n=1 Tax=Bacillus sp. FJAT-29814 TaxID=1729688 RepID=UPI00082A7886|nr:DUF4153 domain-containing protein [Bacillus sp. FJAT-29814]
MKWIKKLQDKLSGLTDAIARFPLTTFFLLGASMIDAYMISTDKNESEYLLTFLLGAFLGAVSQVAYERFYSRLSHRLLLMAAAIVLTAGYYLIIRPVSAMGLEIQIRTYVALFALLIAFIWTPTIKSDISFNKSFMIAFKSFFHSMFFSGVIFAGTAMILGAIDQLIVSLDYKAYPQAANIIFILFAPMYFLSLIPKYSGANLNNQQHVIEKAAHIPKFLEILISYIVIPLINVFTLILLIYLAKNIGGEFWTDNLLEPMIVSYSIAVILVYILASDIENKFTVLFRKISPKILVPIVVLQIISSFITLTDTGLTHTRYYVILYGIFAAASGILLSFLPVRKNGVIAILLIVSSVVSSVPPVDAFTISKNSQIKTVEEILVKNGMLENNEVIPKESIPDEDKEKLTNAIQYLWMMDYTDEISFLPKNFDPYKNFRPTFGFEEYKNPSKFDDVPYTIVQVKHPMPINITGNDFFIQIDIPLNTGKVEEQFAFEKDGKKYTLLKEAGNEKAELKLMNEGNEVILYFKANEILDKFSNYIGDSTISVEEATFTSNNDKAKMTIVIQNFETQRETSPPSIRAMAYVFIQIK